MQVPLLKIELDDETKEELYRQMLLITQQVVEDVTNNSNINKRWKNQRELCEYFQIGVERVREWEIKYGLKYFENGKRGKIYDMRDIEKMIQDNKI